MVSWAGGGINVFFLNYNLTNKWIKKNDKLFRYKILHLCDNNVHQKLFQKFNLLNNEWTIFSEKAISGLWFPKKNLFYSFDANKLKS